MYSCKNQRAHLSIPDGQLQFRYCQLGSLAVHIGPLQHPVDEGGGRGLRRSLRWKGGAARHWSRTRWRAIALRSPLDGPPLARDAADAHVGRHLLQDSSPSVPELTTAPAAEGADDQPDRRLVDKVHSPRTNKSIIR